MRSEQPDVTFVYHPQAFNSRVIVNGEELDGVKRVVVGDDFVHDPNDSERSWNPHRLQDLSRMAKVGVPIEVHRQKRDGDGWAWADDAPVVEVQTFDDWSVERANE